MKPTRSTTKLATLLIVTGLIAASCGFDDIDAAPNTTSATPTNSSTPSVTSSTTMPKPSTSTTSASTTLVPVTIAATTTTTTQWSPSPAAIVGFLGADFTLELAECVSDSATDDTEIAMVEGLIECDFDVLRVSMADDAADAVTASVALFGLTTDESDSYSRCVADEVLILSAEQLLDLSKEASDLFEFGTIAVDSASIPCASVLLDAVSLLDAPLVDKAVRTIIGDEEWEIFEGAVLADGTRTVFVENDVVSIGVSVLDASNRVLWIDFLFNSSDSASSLLGPSLIAVAALLHMNIDETAAQLLLDAVQDFEFDEATICSTYLGVETYIEVVPNGYGCARELGL